MIGSFNIIVGIMGKVLVILWTIIGGKGWRYEQTVIRWGCEGKFVLRNVMRRSKKEGTLW